MALQHIVFDIIITILILASALPAAFLFWKIKLKKGIFYKYKTVNSILACLMLSGSIIIFYGSYIEPRIIIKKQKEIDLPGIEQSIRIALIADMQLGPYKREKFMNRIVEKIDAEKPDLVFIAGDLIDNTGGGLPELEFLNPIQKLSGRTPVYAVNGNHEYGLFTANDIDKPRTSLDLSKKTETKMESLGVRYLANELETITVNSESFYLFGGDEFWTRKLDLSPLDRRFDSSKPTIALLHNPAATWDLAGHDIDLALMGHTHGGQIRLPFIGPLGRADHVIPSKWYKGWYTFEGLKVFVTSGVGESGARARLFNPPEIVYLTIK
ncbi:MAG: metallophosphoesterase [Candidatus Magasanikbacteria bacterium]|nr:metallophosphoesterase [Candidatus Magasanikbacteria bacterium]